MDSEVAVLSVIAFHLHFSPLSGGYVGVDIFFVISGYLITGILMKDFAQGTFSLAKFYERRARRILPALFVVLAFTAGLSYVYLLPAEFEAFASSLLSAVFSYSNIYFWTKTSYFTADGPLLHTWSLAVEEQFYLVFPLLLVFILRRWRKHLRVIIVSLASTSFVISVIGAYSFPTANFYMPYTRAWELLIGGLLPLQLVPAIRSRGLRESCAALGAILVIATVHFYSEVTRFPGLSAVLPCFGAACILFAGQTGNSVVGRLLSLRPLKFIGLISYSLYLWHWPILQFSGRGFLYFDNLTHRENVCLYLVICIALAWLSWKFVETPFRLRKFFDGQRTIFIASLLGMAAASAIACSILALHGLENRYPPAAIALVSRFGNPETQDADFRPHQCFLVSPEPFSTFAKDLCLQEDGTKKNILLLGDSHAAALWYALNTQHPRIHVLQATASNCKPFPGKSTQDGCGQLMSYIYDSFLVQHRVDAVVITARWKDRDLADIASLAKSLHERGIPLLVIGPAEEYDTALPLLLAYALRNNDPNLPDRHRVTQIEDLDRRMKTDASAKWQVPYISLIGALCSAKHCLEYTNEARTIPILFDHDHYTRSGSILAMKELQENGSLLPLQRLLEGSSLTP